MIKDPQIELDHFADIGVFYNELILMVYTHDVGGLTQLDFELALHIDEHLGHLNARTLDEGQAIDNPKNTFLSKSDTAYDFLRVGKTISNLSNAKKSDNRDEPDVMIVPFGGKKEKDHLKKGLKKAGYKTQDADKPGDDAHVDENFADGKRKGKSRPGRVKKSGASCNGTVTQLRKRAKNASGEKAKMYHWCANMKSGRKKK